MSSPNQLVNIALASAIYEQKKNYLDTYLPFLIKIFSDAHVLDLMQISEGLRKVFGIEMPINSIKQLLDLHNGKFFQINKSSRHHWSMTLSVEGKSELADIKHSEERQATKLNVFYNHLIVYADTKFGEKYIQEDLKKRVEDFVIKNLIDISLNRANLEAIDYPDKDRFEYVFLNFLLHIKTNSLEDTETFDEIWKGTIIWNELRKTEITREDSKPFKKLEVYIDTNFILSLLGFHNSIINQAARELYQLAKATKNLELKVLDITLRELNDLLDSYSMFRDDYYEIEIDSVFYFLKKKGVNAVKIEWWKENIPTILRSEYGISTVEVPTWTQDELYRFSDIYNHLFDLRIERNGRIAERLRKKGIAIDKSANHDAASINFALKYKNRNANSFEGSKVIFLTSSYFLFKDYKKISSTYESIPAVVLDATLTNILYLKNPNSNPGISIDQVIKVHCNKLIVDKNVWFLYIQTLNELRSDGVISTEDYARLISKNQVTESYLIGSYQGEAIHKEGVLKVLSELKSEKKQHDQKVDQLAVSLTELRDERELLTEIVKEKTGEVESREEVILELKGEVGVLRRFVAKGIFEGENRDYQDKMNIEWEKHLKDWRRDKRKTVVWYLAFFLISIFLFFVSENISTLGIFSGLQWIGKLVSCLVFCVPMIRSFVKHDRVLEAFVFLFHRRNKKEAIQKERDAFILEYEANNRRPSLSDYENLKLVG